MGSAPLSLRAKGGAPSDESPLRTLSPEPIPVIPHGTLCSLGSELRLWALRRAGLVRGYVELELRKFSENLKQFVCGVNVDFEYCPSAAQY